MNGIPMEMLCVFAAIAAVAIFVLVQSFRLVASMETLVLVAIWFGFIFVPVPGWYILIAAACFQTIMVDCQK